LQALKRGWLRRSILVACACSLLILPGPRAFAQTESFSATVLPSVAASALANSAVLGPTMNKVDSVVVATFDSLPEGTSTKILTDGGITFSGLDRRLPDYVGFAPFVIEQVDDGRLLEADGFTPPNVLTFGGYAPGPGFGLGRVGEFRISTPNRGAWARLELWDAGDVPGNVVTLEAIRRGSVVATDAVSLLGGVDQVHHYTLSVSGRSFDELRVVGSGETDSGVFFGAIDSVRIGRHR
jgi:hypothetical protein